MSQTPDKPQLEFPCDFKFKVFVKPGKIDQAKLQSIVATYFKGQERLISSAVKPSKKGTYHSITLEVRVENHPEIEDLYRQFRALDGVVYLL